MQRLVNRLGPLGASIREMGDAMRNGISNIYVGLLVIHLSVTTIFLLFSFFWNRKRELSFHFLCIGVWFAATFAPFGVGFALLATGITDVFWLWAAAMIGASTFYTSIMSHEQQSQQEIDRLRDRLATIEPHFQTALLNERSDTCTHQPR